MEVEDLSAEIDEPNTNSDQSAETDEINANYDDLSEINEFSSNPENLDDSASNGTTLKFMYDLEPEELQSFQDQDAIPENLEDNTPEMGHPEPSVNVVDSEQISNEGSEEPPNVSSRGRVRRPIRRPLDNDFIWE